MWTNKKEWEAINLHEKTRPHKNIKNDLSDLGETYVLNERCMPEKRRKRLIDIKRKWTIRN